MSDDMTEEAHQLMLDEVIDSYAIVGIVVYDGSEAHLLMKPITPYPIDVDILNDVIADAQKLHESAMKANDDAFKKAQASKS